MNVANFVTFYRAGMLGYGFHKFGFIGACVMVRNR